MEIFDIASQTWSKGQSVVLTGLSELGVITKFFPM